MDYIVIPREQPSIRKRYREINAIATPKKDKTVLMIPRVGMLMFLIFIINDFGVRNESISLQLAALPPWEIFIRSFNCRAAALSSAIGKNFVSQTKNFSVSSLRHLTARQAKAVTWRINMNIGGIAPLKPYSLRRLTVMKACRETAARCLTDKFSHTASKSVAGSFRWHSRKEPATVLKMRISRTKRYNLFPLSPATHAGGMGGDGCKRVWRE